MLLFNLLTDFPWLVSMWLLLQDGPRQFFKTYASSFKKHLRRKKNL
jgi:hypothetical protein